MHEKSMEQLWSTSQLAGGNLAYVEELFESYLRDPNQVPEEWRSYFDTLPRVDDTNTSDVPHQPIRDQFGDDAADLSLVQVTFLHQPHQRHRLHVSDHRKGPIFAQSHAETVVEIDLAVAFGNRGVERQPVHEMGPDIAFL